MAGSQSDKQVAANLGRNAQSVQRFEKMMNDARAKRDKQIIDLAGRGWSTRAIAAVAGISHVAVSKIVKPDTKPKAKAPAKKSAAKKPAAKKATAKGRK